MAGFGARQTKNVWCDCAWKSSCDASFCMCCHVDLYASVTSGFSAARARARRVTQSAQSQHTAATMVGDRNAVSCRCPHVSGLVAGVPDYLVGHRLVRMIVTAASGKQPGSRLAFEAAAVLPDGIHWFGAEHDLAIFAALAANNMDEPRGAEIESHQH